MGNDKQVRPNFDLTLESSIKRDNLKSLVESTISTNGIITISYIFNFFLNTNILFIKNNIAATATVESKEEHIVTNATRDMNKTNIISLSTILNTLQNVDSGTPRRLVDQILMAQKKKKNDPNNAVEETYISPSDRKSMLAIPTGTSTKFDEDILENLSTKLSLDSNTKDEIKSEIVKDETVNVKQEHSRVLSFVSNKNMNVAKSFTNIHKEKILKEEASDKNATFSFNQGAGL